MDLMAYMHAYIHTYTHTFIKTRLLKVGMDLMDRKSPKLQENRRPDNLRKEM
jgi:hypothetical protein